MYKSNKEVEENFCKMFDLGDVWTPMTMLDYIHTLRQQDLLVISDMLSEMIKQNPYEGLEGLGYNEGLVEIKEKLEELNKE